ncbi:aspartate/glutamate racemase family protein [Billgrantia aerodenitrificans]|uniref:Arylsulfatase n=1 Tax=Billgrantia aerodenitrificans TaxID=2733483 RepID=A0ABS9AN38_9GAMM|nr:aspartate/glutamate racemase family protein [Halomonas aerodenitrificans]MCE8023169.1 arylsulfatase [Halomonas aerodenitrificans]
MKVYLIHAVMAAIDPVLASLREEWPEAEAYNLLDDSLEADKANLQADMSPRLLELARYARSNDAAGILFTCSAFGEAIEKTAKALDIPVLKPNEAMFYQAIEQGGRVAMLATFEPAIESMEREFHSIKNALSSEVTLKSFCVPGAREALKAGDNVRHDDLVAEMAAGLSGFDTVMLAHFSTASAARKVAKVTAARILTSPSTAVASLRQRVTMQSGF